MPITFLWVCLALIYQFKKEWNLLNLYGSFKGEGTTFHDIAMNLSQWSDPFPLVNATPSMRGAIREVTGSWGTMPAEGEGSASFFQCGRY